MAMIERVGLNTKAFVIDYCQRHAHPINAFLHIFGVPIAFYGMFRLCGGKVATGSSLVFVGYLLQYLGHKAQGNEVGEVTLIKKIYKKVTAKQSSDS